MKKLGITLCYLILVCLSTFSQSTHAIKFSNCLDEFHKSRKDFYQDFPKVINSPKSSSSDNIIDEKHLFKAVHHDQMILDINEIKKLNKQYVVSSDEEKVIIHDLYVGIIKQGSVTYGKIDLATNELFSQLDKCDNVNFYVSDSTFTFEFCGYRKMKCLMLLG